MSEQNVRLCLVDVGSSGGLEPKWHPYAAHLDYVMFEPNPAAAADLRARPDRPQVIEAALSSATETRTLFVTANPLCISLHRPNIEMVAAYEHQEHFDIVREIPVSCVRYDKLFDDGTVPKPDVIKIDTQGHEYEVLAGFGRLLEHCLGIELESHLYALYDGQKLLGDIIHYLGVFGFVLRRLEPANSFNGDFVEAQAYFTPSRQRVRALDRSAQSKMNLINQIWQLPGYS